MSKVIEIKGGSAVTIKLSDGIERAVKFTLNSMAELEDRYGSVEAGFKALEGGSIKAVIFMLYCGLLESEEFKSEKDVAKLIGFDGLQEIIDILTSALGADMPDTEEVEKAEKVVVNAQVVDYPNK